MKTRKLSTPSYISCIKIRGNPILPPLLTESKRKKVNEDKQKAIEIEMKLELQRKLLTKTTLENQLSLQKSEILDDLPLPANDKLRTLTCETIDVSEYNDTGVNILSHEEEKSQSDDTHHDISVSLETDLPTISQDSITPKPRIIRSNSYTIETPSPILLAHLQKERRSSQHEPIAIGGCNRNSNTSSRGSSPDKYRSITPRTVIDNGSAKENSGEPYKRTETEIKVETISITTPIDVNFHPKKTDIEPQLNDVLKNLPENYSKKILEIIEKHKQEREIILESYENLKKHVDNDLLKKQPENYSTPINHERISNSISVSSNQSLYYTITNTPELLDTPKAQLILPRNITPEKDQCNSEQSIDCSRELFPVETLEEKRQKEREWAASIIGAAVRGYLVRRLMKTKKVCMLIETIKHAVLCAIQLQNAEIIEESDVELHRRLIHQVSSACYAFYDIFFTLPVKERMLIIAKDRQLRREKAKRPSSSASSLSSRLSDGGSMRSNIRTNNRKFVKI